MNKLDSLKTHTKYVICNSHHWLVYNVTLCIFPDLSLNNRHTVVLFILHISSQVNSVLYIEVILVKGVALPVLIKTLSTISTHQKAV